MRIITHQLKALLKGSACLTLSLSLLTQGCSSRASAHINDRSVTPLSKEYGRLVIDAEASELEWDDTTKLVGFQSSSSSLDHERLRGEIATAIERALSARGGETIHIARYRLQVGSIRNNPLWTLMPCFFYFTIFGCPVSSSEATVKLTLEVDRKLYSATGVGHSFQTLYQSHPLGWGIVAVLEATAKALDDIQEQLEQTRSHAESR